MSLDDLDIFDEENSNIDDTYLVFSVDKEEYAIQVKNVVEISRIKKIMKVPDMTEYVTGVINLRGKVVPVIDARIRFNLDKIEYSDRTVVIVIENDENLTGIIVDTVNDVTEILPKDISEPPKQKEKKDIKTNLIKGISKNETSIRIILNIEEFIFSNTKVTQNI